MLRIDFITLFPEMVLGAIRHSITKRAEDSGIVAFFATNPRDFTKDRHRTVDDKPYGGGPGMVMLAEPLDLALSSLPITPESRVVLTDPTGHLYHQGCASSIAQVDHLVLLCGHYEGIDDRVREKWVTDTFSLGDFVVTGGELPSLIVADSVVRLLPGVLGCGASLDIDSHADGLLSAPQYSKPAEYCGFSVPDVLRSGDHAGIDAWKRTQSLRLTRTNRPDLFCRATLSKSDLNLLQS